MTYRSKATATRAPAVRKRKASDQLTTVRALAELLLVSDRTVRRWIEDKKLTAHHIGGAIRVGCADLIVFIQRARKGGAPLGARNPLEDTFYTVENIAEILNVCVRTVRRRIDSGVLVAHDLFGIIRIAESDLRDFIERSARD
jgi:excisionase family DNA binding protein